MPPFSVLLIHLTFQARLQCCYDVTLVTPTKKDIVIKMTICLTVISRQVHCKDMGLLSRVSGRQTLHFKEGKYHSSS